MRPSPGENEEIGPELRNALRALAEADRGLEARPEVEVRLRSAFRKKQRKAFVGNVWPAVWAIAAGAVLAVGLWYARGTKQVEAPQVANSTPVVVDLPVAPAPARHVEQAHVEQVASRPIAPREQHVQQQEIATDFFPLVDFAPPMDNGELVRVSLPASAMRQVGLPVREDRMADLVQADVVMNNGLATAIRFVRNSE
jgi:hypothetical protein